MPLSQLHPQAVWAYFADICAIPRPSHHEGQLIAYLQRFAAQHGLPCDTDAAGNVLITKPASPGYAHSPTVVLQSHLDMVCEKNEQTVHDFLHDPILPYVDGPWVKAKGTTLGSDDGIGVAAQLAVLADQNLVHGPLECVFTANEEAGMTGIMALSDTWLKGRILLNLDSEDEGELFIGCAGGMDTTARLTYRRRPKLQQHQYLRLELKGLQGGHSGDEIHKGLGNAVKLMNRFLWIASHQFELRLHSFDAGNLRNAIAREAVAVVAVPHERYAPLRQAWEQFLEEIKAEYRIMEPRLRGAMSEAKPCPVLSKDLQRRLLSALYACPHGELYWDKELPNLVQTSTNLAAVSFRKDEIIITTSQRSSVASSVRDVAAMVRSVFQLAGAQVQQGDGYPAWKPRLDSPILALSQACYQKRFGQQPQVKAIHAGLECGFFVQKYPDMDMISFGPTVRGAHSPDERLEIASVPKFWLLLVDILESICINGVK